MRDQGKVTWNDIHSATFKELKQTYKLNDRQLEHQVRSHLHGANAQERRNIYDITYRKK